jgi:hypothetical protein
MPDLPLHTIYISFPDDAAQKLRIMHDAIVKRFGDASPFPVDWVPHIDVYTARVKPEDAPEYIELFKKLDLQKFRNTIFLEKLAISENNKFIFIEPSDESKKYIFNLRAYIESFLGKYKDLTLTDYYKERWETYTKEQQERILKTGGFYSYSPHFTVIKLLPENSVEAFRIAQKYFEPFNNEVKLTLTAQNMEKTYLFEKVHSREL